MKIIYDLIYFSIVFIIFIYALLKERNEFGCSSYFSIKQHCNDFDSVYFKHTHPLHTDSKNILIKKLKNILSIHSKFAVWRKCFIIATIIIFFTKGLDPTIKSPTLISLHIMIMSIIYFYHNFMYHHFYKTADNIGTSILDALLNKK